MQTISVINQKGGVGKTSTALALAAGLADKGKKVLAIDLDAQGNFSYTAGADESKASIVGVLLEETKADTAIQSNGKFDFIQSSSALTNDAILLGKNEAKRPYLLRAGLQTILGRYDYCVIDTPPVLNILTINALTASDKVIIPAEADMFSLQGLEQLAGTIKSVQDYTNNALKIAGILLTFFDGRAVLSKDMQAVFDRKAKEMGTRLYKSTIRKGVAVKEAEAMRQSLFDYAPKSKVAEDYAAFINEFMQDLKER